MQIGNNGKKTPVKQTEFLSNYHRFSKWLLILLVGSLSCAQAQAPDITYSGPLTISKGGTYSGNYRSTSSGTPVIIVNTTEPVILQNCVLVGPGVLVSATRPGTDLTMRECKGYGTTPTVDNVQRGFFLDMYQAKNLVFEHNYLESNRGVQLNRWTGNGSPGQALKIRYNVAKNMIGTMRNAPAQGLSNFVLLNTILGLPNLEIAWNQVINLPNQSKVEDNINFYNSGGTPTSPARVHDNYVQGAYPIPATDPTFNGTGMTTDGGGTTLETSTGFLEIDHNQFVSTCNSGVNVAAGHDVNVHDNRIVTSGYLTDGTKLSKVYNGIGVSSWYGIGPPVFGNIQVNNNIVGYANWYKTAPYPNRFDFNTAQANSATGNVSLPNPITVQTEQNEWTLWQQKLQQNGITPGVTGGTAPNPTIETPTTTPTPTAPAPAPTNPTGATFYRAFDLNGDATTIDGNKWEAGSAVQVSGNNTFVGQGVALSPATDAARTAMLVSSVYGNNLRLTVSNVPSASYLVYLHVWEDNDAQTYSVAVNGKQVQTNYNSGAAGHWDRLGPYAATVTNGTLTVTTSGGTANCSGLELWTASGTVANSPAPAPTPVPSAESTFYRAVNLNGSSTTIDGNQWDGASAADYYANGNKFSLQNQALTPSTDANRAAMLRSCQYGNSLDLQLTAVPSGSYLVYAYVWEDNFTETYSLMLNGQTAASKLQTGAAGTWAKLGPYPVAVTDGTIRLTSSGGTVNLSGIEVWQQATTTSLARSAAGASASTPLAGTAPTDPTTVYPNPLVGSQSRVQVAATLAQAEQVVLQVLNRMGTLVQQATVSFPAGTSSQFLEVGTLPQGTYLVRFASGSLLGKTLGLIKAD